MYICESSRQKKLKKSDKIFEMSVFNMRKLKSYEHHIPQITQVVFTILKEHMSTCTCLIKAGYLSETLDCVCVCVKI